MIDLSDRPSAEANLETIRLAKGFLEEKVDLSVGPLFEAKLWKLSDREHVLILMIDHIISDGLSNGILNREIWTLYEQGVQGLPFSLPSLPIQFADYAIWQERTLHSWMEKHAAYWKVHLKGAPPTRLLTERELVSSEHPIGLTVHIPFGNTVSVKLREIAEREQAPLALVVLAVYTVAMSHWCAQDSLLMAFMLHGRYGRPELESMIGPLISLPFMRVEFTRENCFLDLLKRVALEFESAVEHQDFNRVPDFVPGLTTELAYQWRSRDWAKRTGNILLRSHGSVRTQPFIARLPNWVLKFWSACYDTPAGVFMTVQYRPDLIAPDAIERFGTNIRAIAERFAENPRVRIGPF